MDCLLNPERNLLECSSEAMSSRVHVFCKFKAAVLVTNATEKNYHYTKSLNYSTKKADYVNTWKALASFSDIRQFPIFMLMVFSMVILLQQLLHCVPFEMSALKLNPVN